ncbi:hypothetical protein GCM10027038_39540 [Arthrobacter bambusae]
MTRETVACETPAMDATSAMPTRRVFLLPGMVSFLELLPPLLQRGGDMCSEMKFIVRGETVSLDVVAFRFAGIRNLTLRFGYD